MKTPFLRILFLAALATPLALVGCQTETEVEREPDGGVEIEREPGIDEAEVEDALNDAGEALEDAGEAVQEGVEDAAQTVDDNVDLGDNAGDPDPADHDG